MVRCLVEASAASGLFYRSSLAIPWRRLPGVKLSITIKGIPINDGDGNHSMKSAASFLLVALAAIASCTLLVAVIGATVGYGLGKINPSYYRSVFRNGREAGFDPVSIGVGQGLTQGTAGGVVVGLALVALLSWRETRRQRSEGTPPRVDNQPDRVLIIAWAGFCSTVFLLVIGFCFTSGLIVGEFRGEGGAYYRQYENEREAVTPILATHPAFTRIEAAQSPAGGVYLTGEVPQARGPGPSTKRHYPGGR
jgi:hypothetical protein